ncbi:MAG: hypothetical protein SVX43_06775 [Cyanobacteriota bacterium]|nr:hypothetical protein [Cyanobacteriota bacterium]
MNCTRGNVEERDRDSDRDLKEEDTCRLSEEDEEVPILDTSEAFPPENAP